MPMFAEYLAALQRCMQAEPPVNKAFLSKDSNVLADVYAEMLYTSQAERPLEVLTDDQRAAFERWKVA